MIGTVLKWMGVTAIIGLIVLWLATGGISSIRSTASHISNPLRDIMSATNVVDKSRGWGITLPWQPADLGIGVQLQNIDGTTNNPEEDIASISEQIDQLEGQVQDAQTFGDPSPYRGAVRLGSVSGAQQSTGSEYVTLSASGLNTAPVDISGWSIQSAVTGVRAYIPRGANLFLLGNLNEQQDISLNPGFSAIVMSGFSPVGTSFRENTCSGYLAQSQQFEPSLSETCPEHSDSLPLTADNIRTYGDSCFDYLRSLPSCTFPTSFPTTISSACRLFVSNHFSYNGCVQDNRGRPGFQSDTWRIYLGATNDLWRNTHDIVRLLDRGGRTVDVLTY